MTATIETFGRSDPYDFDIGAAERTAYQRGDVALAELLGRLLSAEDTQTENEREANERAEEESQRANKAESDLEDLRVTVRDRIANLEALFDSAAKCSNRKDIGDAIEALYATVEGK